LVRMDYLKLIISNYRVVAFGVYNRRHEFISFALHKKVKTNSPQLIQWERCQKRD
jgi:hypothetical protein